MDDTTGKIPAIRNPRHALEEILRVASDKRSHVLAQEACDWLELKMRVIRILAKRGIAKAKG